MATSWLQREHDQEDDRRTRPAARGATATTPRQTWRPPMGGRSVTPKEAPQAGAGYGATDDLVLRPSSHPVRVARGEDGDVVAEARGPIEVRHESAPPHARASSMNAAASSTRAVRSDSSASINSNSSRAWCGRSKPIVSPTLIQ